MSRGTLVLVCGCQGTTKCVGESPESRGLSGAGRRVLSVACGRRALPATCGARFVAAMERRNHGQPPFVPVSESRSLGVSRPRGGAFEGGDARSPEAASAGVHLLELWRRVLQQARRIVRCHDDAAAIASAVVERLMEHARRDAEPAARDRWCAVVCRRLCLDLIRGRRREAVQPYAWWGTRTARPAQQVGTAPRAPLESTPICPLSSSQQDVVRLLQAGRSVAAVAELRGTTVRAVRKTCRSLLLRAELESHPNGSVSSSIAVARDRVARLPRTAGETTGTRSRSCSSDSR